MFIFSPSKAGAAAGVGIDTGKILVSEILQKSSITQLPPIVVYNTGDTTANYSMEVAFNEKQDEYKPDADWIEFSPKNFALDPGGSQVVTATLRLPVEIKGGVYFAYLEAQGKEKGADGMATISTAAAAKFYFTVANPVFPEEPSVPTVAPLSIVPFVLKSQMLGVSLDAIEEATNLTYFSVNRLVQDQMWKQKIL